MAFRHALFVFFLSGSAAVFSHRMHGTHRKFRGCSSLCCTNRAEMYCPQSTLRRVWHPCHTHATHLIILPQMAQINTDGQGAHHPTDGTLSLLLWEDAVETTAPPGRVRGYGRDAIPSYNCTDWEGVLKYLCASVTSVGVHFSKRLLCVL